MVPIPSEADEEARRAHREREDLICERRSIVNKMGGILATLGVKGFKALRPLAGKVLRTFSDGNSGMGLRPLSAGSQNQHPQRPHQSGPNAFASIIPLANLSWRGLLHQLSRSILLRYSLKLLPDYFTGIYRVDRWLIFA
jgi:hypothetical protein